METTTRLTLTGHTSGEERGVTATIDLPPAFVREYSVEKLLGAGAMGSVFLARQRTVNRAVALKVLNDSSPARLERFRREGRILARISHPHVLSVYDCGEFDGYPYLVTELLEGRSLRELLKGPMPVADALRIGIACLHGLAACHEAGIIHRDIKPENILFTSAGDPKIADLGVAFDETETVRLTKSGAIVGTPLYMAPEVLLGDGAGPRSDLWAMAAVMYEMIAVVTPVTARSLPQLMAAHLNPAIVPLRERVTTVPPAVSDALSRALAREPAHRMASAKELAQALSEASLRPTRRRTGHSLRRGEATDCTVAAPVTVPVPGSRRWAPVAVIVTLVGMCIGFARTSQLVPAHSPTSPGARVVQPVVASPDARRVPRPTRAGDPLRAQGPLEIPFSVGMPIVPAVGALPSGALARIGRGAVRGVFYDRAAIAAGGAVAATCEGRARVTIWDTATRRATRQMFLAGGEVLGLALSGDGAVLAAQLARGELLVWEWRVARAPIKVGTIAGRLEPDLAMALSHDGRTLALANGTTLVMLDPTVPRQRTFHAPTPITCTSLSPDGRLVAAGHTGGLVTIWETDTGDVVHRTPEHPELTAYGDREVGLTLLNRRPGPGVIDIAFSPDASELASIGFDRRLVIRNVASRKQSVQLTFKADVTGLAWSPDARAVSTFEGYRLRVIPLHGERSAIDIANLTLPFAWSQDGRRIISVGKGGADSPILQANALTGEVMSPVRAKEPRRFEHVRFTADGRRLVGYFDGRLELRDASTGRVLSGYPTGCDVVSYGHVELWGREMITASWNRQLAILDVGSSRVLRQVQALRRVVAHTLSRYMSALAWVEDAQPNGAVVRILRGPGDPTVDLSLTDTAARMTLAFNEDGSRLAVLTPERLYLIDVKARRGQIIRPATYIREVNFVIGDRELAITERDKIVLYDLQSGACQFVDGRFGVLSPDGNAAAVRSENGVEIVDLRTRSVTHAIQVPQESVSSLVLSPGLKRAATVQDESLIVWDLSLIVWGLLPTDPRPGLTSAPPPASPGR